MVAVVEPQLPEASEALLASLGRGRHRILWHALVAAGSRGLDVEEVIGTVYRAGQSPSLKTVYRLMDHLRDKAADVDLTIATVEGPRARRWVVDSALPRSKAASAQEPRDAPRDAFPSIPIVFAGAAAAVDATTRCSCRWPLGEVVADNFRFCGEPTIDGKAYCASHAERAFSGVWDARRAARGAGWNARRAA